MCGQVQYTSKNDVPFLAMGGGHGGSTTLGKLHNGLKIDLGNFHAVDVNSSANLMITGGSVTGADVTSALQIAGKEIRQCRSTVSS